MKQHHLSTKFLRFYILIGILGFFLITLGGSYMVEKHLEHSLSAALYTEAHNIASNEAVKSNISSSTVDTLQEHLCAISDFQDAVLWIINSNGEIIVSTQKNIDVREPIPLEEFDASKWGSNYYQIGKFYGFFKTDHLSVIAPITSDMETKGYVAIHYSMTNLYQSRSSILFIMQVIFLLCYAATSLLLWAYSHYIRKPLARIMKGASEYAGGNLAYKIDVTSDDEMGYLAKTLNYMSDELNKNGEYQRKFIANVSHDFRSPLTSIKGYVTAMLDGTIPPEETKHYLGIVSQETGRLARLVQNMLDITKLEAGEVPIHAQTYDLWKTVTDVVLSDEQRIEDGKIDIQGLGGDPLLIYADPDFVHQVVYNIVDNAIKFTPAGGTISFAAERRGNMVEVRIENTGAGIAPEALPFVFERFYKEDRSRGMNTRGSGLGLHICKVLITLSGGQIKAESEMGKWCRFTFTLPAGKTE